MTNSHRPMWGLVLVALLSLTLLAGCGSSTADVSGTVTVKGQPPKIQDLTISLMGVDGRPVTVYVAEDGTYTAKGIAAGEIKVGFGLATSAAFLDAPEAEKLAAKERAAQAKKAAEVVPKNYFDPRTSGITTTLNPGSNSFDFDIK